MSAKRALLIYAGIPKVTSRYADTTSATHCAGSSEHPRVGGVSRGERRMDLPPVRSSVYALEAVLPLMRSRALAPGISATRHHPIAVKFGAPLSREIFRVPPGFDLVVDYGAGYQVCKLQVPPLMPMDATKVQNTDDMKQKMHAFLADLVPDSMRGKELQQFMSQSGAFSGVGVDEYEHVSMVETYRAPTTSMTRTVISGTVRFKQKNKS
jgi:hypothetical protein